MTKTTGTGTGNASDSPTLKPRIIYILLDDNEPCTIVIAHNSAAVWSAPGVLDVTKTPHTQVQINQ